MNCSGGAGNSGGNQTKVKSSASQRFGVKPCREARLESAALLQHKTVLENVKVAGSCDWTGSDLDRRTCCSLGLKGETSDEKKMKKIEHGQILLLNSKNCHVYLHFQTIS